MYVILSLAGNSAASTLEILTPPGYVSICSDQIYLVGKTDAEYVEVKLNEKPAEKYKTKDSIFHALLKFGYGLNEIVVTPIILNNIRDTSNNLKIEVLVGPKIQGKYEEIYSDYQFHNDKPKTECLSCHNSSKGMQLKGNFDDACFECHRDMQLKFKTHIPESEKTCVNCHKFNQDLSILMQNSFSDKNLCYDCHKDKIGEFSQDYIHGPVAGGSCTICHNPHGSQYDNNLINPTEVLCSTCHIVVDEARNFRIQHNPFEHGHCNECHDPHSTNNKWVLIKTTQKLCISCHDESGALRNHDHPFDVKPKKKLVTDLKLTDRGYLECLTCHDPHASNAEHLLRTNQEYTCLGCHPDR